MRHVPTRDVGDGNPQPASGAEMQAEFLLLSDLGYGNCTPADDDESQQFAAHVRALNPDWQPGTIPVVPTGYHSGRRERMRHELDRVLNRRPRQRVVRPATRRPATTSRRRPQARRTARTAGSRGDPHLADDPDPLARWIGLLEASARMHQHVLRRSAAMAMRVA
jgi:hypothetical protein